MASSQATLVLRHVRRLVLAPTESVSDIQLLDQFVLQRNESAFAELVRRHGPLVLGVCRRVLGNLHDAEDAFQATFLMLARKADSVGRRGELGGWLYRVAFRQAVRTRSACQTRKGRERLTDRAPAIDPLDEITGRELLTVLDEELQRLPERCRTPFVLCHLEGQTRDQAAGRLGLSPRTVKRRLAEGRERLQRRLTERGLTLPAGLLALGAMRVAVPPRLTAAVAQTAAAAARAGFLTRTMAAGAALLAGRGTVAAMIVLVATMLAASLHLALGTTSAQGNSVAVLAMEPVQKPAASSPPAARAAEEAKAEDANQVTITGRVLDPQARPAPDATVFVSTWQGLRLSSWENWVFRRYDVVGTTTTDTEGRFRLTVGRPQAGNVRSLWVTATAKGQGMGWKSVDPNAREATAEVKLAPEQVVRGRLLDLQGAPAAGVKVRLVRLIRNSNGSSFRLPEAKWPDYVAPATTDSKGYFTLRGLGNDQKAEIEIRDDRFGEKDVEVNGSNKKQAESLLVILPPAHVVEGRVLDVDTGKPLVGCKVEVNTNQGSFDSTTDANGHYRVSFVPSEPNQPGGEYLFVTAHPAAGEGHLVVSTKIDPWPRGVVRQTVDLKAQRGVLVQGKVTEAGSGKPVAGAVINYRHDWGFRVLSGPDGTFRIAVPEGAGHLAVTAPTPDYIPQVVGFAEGGFDRPAGERIYYHGVAAFDAKRRDEPKEVNVTLRRGVTLKGRLVRPDGKPVASAVMFSGGHRPAWEKNMQPVTVRNGTFQLPGCDPDKTYRLMFLEHDRPLQLMMMAEDLGGIGVLHLPQLMDVRNKLGAVVELSAKKASEEVEVKLVPCGSARVRFLDPKGKPLVGYTPGLQLVVAPGPTLSESMKAGTLAAEVVGFTDPYGGGDLKTDAEGWVTFPGLIPGATYRVRRPAGVGSDRTILREFTPVAGKTTTLEVKVD
jgi:RNA polymerase sigma factor (sigma-70 family)